jgi:hypothetical protein
MSVYKTYFMMAHKAIQIPLGAKSKKYAVLFKGQSCEEYSESSSNEGTGEAFIAFTPH